MWVRTRRERRAYYRFAETPVNGRHSAVYAINGHDSFTL